MDYQHIQIPSVGGKITVNDDFSLNVPDNPIIPFIEGDGIGIAHLLPLPRSSLLRGQPITTTDNCQRGPASK